MTNTKIVIISALVASLSGNAYGYVDPGTGSILFQIILGAIAGAAVTCKMYFHRIKSFFKKK